MQCTKCVEQAIWLTPLLCKKHFIYWFENIVKKTIKDYDLIPINARICVAASGGKDSLTTLYLLKKLGYDVQALVIDEGIENYREHTIIDLKNFCELHSITLQIASFTELTGKTLDTMLAEKKLLACTICGTFRRYLLNKCAKEFDVLATGHNADDEAQAVLMNLLRTQTTLLTRTGPTTTIQKGFIKRIKPLYFCTEKMVMTYTLLQNIVAGFTECPNVKTSYRAQVRDVLNVYAEKYPGVQGRVLTHFLDNKTRSQPATPQPHCALCNEPSMGSICNACRLKEVVNS